MDTNKSIEHVLDSMDQHIVYKAKSSLLPALLLLAIGIASFVIHSVIVWKTNSVFPPMLMMLGSVSVIVALFQISFRKNHYISAVNHQRLKLYEIYFQVAERNRLLQLLEKGDLKEIVSLKPSLSDGLKLRMLATKDGQLCFSQVIAYESNEHTNIGSVMQYTLPKSLFLTNYARRGNRN